MARARGIAAVEPLEDVRELVRRNARAAVGDREKRMPLLPTDPHGDRAAGRGELHRIVEQDHHQLSQEVRVTVHRGFLELPDLERHALSVGHDPRGVGCIEHDVIKENSASLDGQLSGLGACQREQVIHDAREPVALGIDSLKRRDIARPIARLLQGDLRAAPQHAQRRAELVRGVGHEPAHLFDRLLDWGNRLANQK